MTAQDGAVYNVRMEKRKTEKMLGAAIALIMAMAAAFIVFGCGGKGKGGRTEGETVTVTFVTESGQTTAEVERGGVVQAPVDPEKSSDERYTYEFYGWYTESGERYEFDRAVTGDIVLTARFYAAARLYTVRFDNEGEISEKSVEYGAKAEKPTDPQKPSDDMYTYSFDGWYTEDGESYDFESETVGDITLFARYKKSARLYTVRYINDGNVAEARYGYGATSVEPAAPEKADGEKTEYIFLGWYTLNGVRYEFGGEIKNDIDLYARYEAANKPKVTFVSDGGAIRTEYVKRGARVQRPQDPQKPSTAEYEYVFEQWNDGDGAYDFDKAVTADLTLTATYTQSKRRYTVTFMVGGTLYGQTTAEYGGGVVLPAEPQSTNGDVFTGWYTESDASWTGSSAVTGDVTLTAKFEQLFVFAENADGYTVTGIRRAQSDGILTIPNTYNGRSVTEIGDGAFGNAQWIAEVRLPQGMKRIGGYAFNDCAALERIVFNSGLESIGDYAFVGIGASELELPESVTTVGVGAFTYCDELVEVRIHVNVEEIGEWAFTDCGDGLIVYYDGDEQRWNGVAATDYALFGVEIVFGTVNG